MKGVELHVIAGKQKLASVEVDKHSGGSKGWYNGSVRDSILPVC